MKTKEYEIVPSRAPGIVGDSHRYKSEKGIISLVHPCMATMDAYEIYCIEGDLFEDIERFETLNEAEERISQLLEP